MLRILFLLCVVLNLSAGDDDSYELHRKAAEVLASKEDDGSYIKLTGDPFKDFECIIKFEQRTVVLEIFSTDAPKEESV